MKLFFTEQKLFDIEKKVVYQGLSNIPENLYLETEKEYSLQYIGIIKAEGRYIGMPVKLHPLVERFIFESHTLNKQELFEISNILVEQKHYYKQIQTKDILIKKSGDHTVLINYNREPALRVAIYKSTDTSVVQLFQTHCHLDLSITTRSTHTAFRQAPAFPLTIYQYN